MSEFGRIEGEKESLSLHVDLCQMRYRQLVRYLFILAGLIAAARATQPDIIAYAAAKLVGG